MAQISHLPLEILSISLKYLDSTIDLFHAVQASPILARAFWSSSKLHLAAVLQNSISVVAQPFALALVDAPSIDSGSLVPVKDVVESFLEKRFTNSRTTFPSDTKSLIQMSHRQNRIKRFQAHYAALALSKGGAIDIPIDNLPWWAVMNRDPQLARIKEVQATRHLSSSEKARFERGFYLHELLCRIFAHDDYSRRRAPKFSAEEQYHLFLRRIPAFQAEEASCVHQYFMEIAGRCFDQIEDAFVQDAINFSSARWDFFGDCDSSGNFQKGIYALDEGIMEYCDIKFYSSTQPKDDSASYAASRGLNHSYECLSAGEKLRFVMIRDSIKGYQEFLPQALLSVPVEGPPYPDFTYHNDDPNHANQAWLKCMYGPSKNWLGRYYLEDHFCHKRDLAFVFWDSWRLNPGSLWEMLLKSPRPPQKEPGREWPRSCIPADLRLVGLTVSTAEFSSLVKRYHCSRYSWPLRSKLGVDDEI